MFQNLTCCKISVSKNDELIKVDRKSDVFWKSWFKIWRVVKNLFQNLILFKSLRSQTGFYALFLHTKFFEKADNCRSWGFACKKFHKRFCASKTSIKICFFYKSNSLRNLIRCQTCLFEIWQILKFSILNCRVVKNGSKSDTFEFPDSKHDASYKNASKTDYFQKV